MIVPQDELIERSLRPGAVYAVVGASRHPVKAGYRVYAYLRRRNVRAYAVNPLAERVMEEAAYPDLKALPQRPDVVVIVVQPHVALGIVEQAHRQCVPNIWLQPGAESAEILRYAADHGFSVVHHACIMTEHFRRWGSKAHVRYGQA